MTNAWITFAPGADLFVYDFTYNFSTIVVATGYGACVYIMYKHCAISSTDFQQNPMETTRISYSNCAIILQSP